MTKLISETWADGGFGHYTKEEPMYLEYLEKLLPRFSGGSVLEIGPGTGLFAKMLIDKFDINKYTVLDLEKNIFDSVNKLKHQYELDYVFAQDFRNLFNQKFDLVVSNICIPETPKEYREELLNNIIPNTQRAMIIGQLNGVWVDGDEYEVWLKGLFENSFNKVSCELTPYRNCHALVGVV